MLYTNLYFDGIDGFIDGIDGITPFTQWFWVRQMVWVTIYSQRNEEINIIIIFNSVYS